MTKAVDLRLPFVAPAGMPGLLQLQHDGGASKALLTIQTVHSGGAIGCASLTPADIRLLVDGLMDALCAIERQERLRSGRLEDPVRVRLAAS